MGYRKAKFEQLLGPKQQEHLFWKVDGIWEGPKHLCRQVECTYSVCTKTESTQCADGSDGCSECVSCEDRDGTIDYYWTTKTAGISVNITTPEVYFWNYGTSPPEQRDYKYKFAFNYMSGNYIDPCPPRNC